MPNLFYVIREIKNNNISRNAINNEKNTHQSRWLTIASTSDDNEIIILTHNSGSDYKNALTSLSVGSQVKMNWMTGHLSVLDAKAPIICFASDVGVASIRPIIREWAGKREIIFNHLDKGVKVFDREMEELSNKVADLTYETSASLIQSQDNLKNVVDRHGNNSTYILAGQPDDVRAMKQFLKAGGIDSKTIKVDSFTGLK